MPKNVGDSSKLIIAKGFEKLPNVQKNHPIWSHWIQTKILPQDDVLRAAVWTLIIVRTSERSNSSLK